MIELIGQTSGVYFEYSDIERRGDSQRRHDVWRQFRRGADPEKSH